MVSQPALGRPRRIFIDATFTLASGKNSGIERVVRNLLQESISLSESEDSATLGNLPNPRLIVSHAGKFFEADDEYVNACERLGAAHANILGNSTTPYQRLAEFVCSIGRWSKLRKWLLPSAGHLGIFKLLHTFQASRALRLLAARQPAVVGQPGDLFLLPDAYWINRLRNSVWPAASEARSRGAFIGTVIYDLIPLTHPEFVGQKRQDSFLDYLTKAATYSDLLLAISQTVSEQVKEFLPNLATSGDLFCNDIRSFSLGAELKVSKGEVRSKVSSTFVEAPAPYLMVATFDPRKNHSYVLDTFDALWERDHNLRLCFVGRTGARCDDVVKRIRQHPLFGTKLFLYDDLSDAELQYCYTNSRAVIFPSIVEGFGLPIVEALWFGKKTFASDTPIHREVGANDCVYFKLSSPSYLVQAIERWENAVHNETTPLQTPRVPTSWRGSTTELLSHCLSAMESRSGSLSSMPHEQAA